MATPRSFTLYQLDGVTPKTDASPTFAPASGGIYSTRSGVAISPPPITNLGGGQYGYLASDFDESLGVCALSAFIPDSLPSRVFASICTYATSFHVMCFFDVNGDPWVGANASVGQYVDFSGASKPSPSLVAITGSHFFSLTPTDSDRLAGRTYRVDAAPGAFPASYGETFYAAPPVIDISPTPTISPSSGGPDGVSITKLIVRSFNLDQLDIFWEISPIASPPSGSTQPHEVYDYDFYVLKSEAALGPYEQIGGPLRDIYQFRDVQVHLLHHWRQYHYKIKMVHRVTGKETTTAPASSTDPEPDLIAAEIIRQEDILFREFVGRRCILFPARTFGPACSCFDVYTGRKLRSGCKLCFGTGWLGGFMSPVEVFVQIDVSPKVQQETQLQTLQPGDTSARMISFPPVAPNDILVETENVRWKVKTMTPTQRLRSTVRQELTLHEIPKGDIEYGLPIRVDLKTFKPAAERNFTNPQNPRDDDFADIFASYGSARGTRG